MTPTFPRHMTPLGRVNWIGFWTLYSKEVRRFLKVWLQTVAAPVISTLIFMAIFALAIGKTRGEMAGVPFAHFLLPGLIMMAILQNAFANSSSSLVIAKMQGNIIDVLMPPLSPWELALAYIGGGATRGILVGATVATVLLVTTPVTIEHPILALIFALEAALMMSAIGVLTGIWAEKFDQTSVISNFIVTPLSFLSGTFYAIDHLPEAVRWIAHINPFFYMIDGFRGAVIGISSGHLGFYLAVVTVMNAVLVWWVHHLFRIGYKIKS